MKRVAAGIGLSLALASGGMAGCGEDAPRTATATVSDAEAAAAKGEFNKLSAFWQDQEFLEGAGDPSLVILSGDSTFQCVGADKLTSAELTTSYCEANRTVVLPAAAMLEQDKTTVGPLARTVMLGYELGNWVQAEVVQSEVVQPAQLGTPTQKRQRSFCLAGRAMAFEETGSYDQNASDASARYLGRLTQLDEAAYGSSEAISAAYLAGTNGEANPGIIPCADPKLWA